MIQKKRHLRYSLWSNLRYYARAVAQYQPNLYWHLLLYIVTMVVINLIGAALPVLVVSLLGQTGHFNTYVLMACGVAVTLALLHWTNGWADNRATTSSIIPRTRLTQQLNDHIMAIDYAQLERPKIQELVDQARENGVSMTMSGAQAMFYGIREIAVAGVSLTIFAATLSAFSPIIFVLAGAAALVSYFALQGYRQWYAANVYISGKLAHRQNYLSRNAYEVANGKDIRLYAMQGWYHDHLTQLVHDRNAWTRADSRHLMFANLLSGTAGIGRDGIALVYLVQRILARSLNVGQFTLFFSMLSQFGTLTQQLVEGIDILSKASIDLQELREFLDMPVEDDYASLPLTVQSALAKRPIAIIFDHVSYRYPEAQRDTLSDISFTLHAGEKLALVGINGAGKTTITKLMMGLIHPSAGRVLLNGIDAAQIPTAQQFALFAPVFQDTQVLALPLAQNIALSDPADPERLQASIKAADLTTIVDQLPKGTKTPMTRYIDMDGTEFSGGQAQMLMLARALYKQAPVLILDEPTAALDAIAESELYQKYAQLTQGKSTLFISHRLASTRFCDRIIFLENGHIVENGTHEQLLAKHGRYAEMYHIQSRYYQKNTGEAVSND
ncbi:ABC transporter ATP-binding protein [Schleiferilactobacillus perolens]|jgi:ATP-binding cassette subfamily B protein|uniref:ABC transporter ATP-binding protein n=1 Tax=Schleiferilactobacillus perolens TaxID=100468 RepID=UPI0023578AD7|nr:ABC transporter ATP-binding protein [Schleiferilactobacillus perolens]MCI2171329.1 ABC transporter ATP-binding protein/permease [Schleiferilactobacillus perolens]